MALSAQEELLATRRAALVALREQVADTDLYQRSHDDAVKLNTEIDRQISVLDYEAWQRGVKRTYGALFNKLLQLKKLRAAINKRKNDLKMPQDLADRKAALDKEVAAALEKAADLPAELADQKAALEKEIADAYKKDLELPKELADQKAALEQAVVAAIEEAKPFGFVPAEPRVLAEDLKAADAGYEDAVAELKETREAQAELYTKKSLVADPCIPCLEKQLAMIKANDQHYERAINSAKHFSGQQKNKDTCALMSTQSVLLERDGKAPPEGFAIKNWRSFIPSLEDLQRARRGENDMIDIGKGSGGYSPCNGTTNSAKVMTAAGIAAVLTEKPTLDQIAAALDDGKAVLVSYDARPVWDAIDPSAWDSATPFNHCIRATGVDRDALGAVRGFWINDSGDGNAGVYVPADVMTMALKGHGVGGRLSVSDDRLMPPVGQGAK